MRIPCTYRTTTFIPEFGIYEEEYVIDIHKWFIIWYSWLLWNKALIEAEDGSIKIVKIDDVRITKSSPYKEEKFSDRYEWTSYIPYSKRKTVPEELQPIVDYLEREQGWDIHIYEWDFPIGIEWYEVWNNNGIESLRIQDNIIIFKSDQLPILENGRIPEIRIPYNLFIKILPEFFSYYKLTKTKWTSKNS